MRGRSGGHVHRGYGDVRIVVQREGTKTGPAREATRSIDPEPMRMASHLDRVLERDDRDRLGRRWKRERRSDSSCDPDRERASAADRRHGTRPLPTKERHPSPRKRRGRVRRSGSATYDISEPRRTRSPESRELRGSDRQRDNSIRKDSLLRCQLARENGQCGSPSQKSFRHLGWPCLLSTSFPGSRAGATDSLASSRQEMNFVNVL